MTNYIGVLDGTGKTWGVRIPDMPGCYGGGASAEAAIGDATSAAREWLAQKLSKGLAQPKARNLSAIIKAGEFDTSNKETAVMLSVIWMSAARCAQISHSMQVCWGLLIRKPTIAV